MLRADTIGTRTSLRRMPSNPGRTAGNPARAMPSVDAPKDCAGSPAAQQMEVEMSSPAAALLKYLFTPSFFEDVWERTPLVLPHGAVPRNPFVEHRWIAEEDMICMSYRAAVAGTLKIFRQGVAISPPSMPLRAPLRHWSREERHRGGTASSSRSSRVIEGETESICGSEESEDARDDGDTCANTSGPALPVGSASAVQGACLPPPGGELSASLNDTIADSSDPGSSCLLACVGPYLDGCSLVVNQADRTHPGLHELCRTLGQRLFTHVFAVAYLTPPSSYAVGTHTDDQDVFLIQLWGQKQWKIYAPPQQLPLSEEMLGKTEPFGKDPGQPVLQLTLEEGDILYIPRGFPHEAVTTTQNSLHITITVPTAEYAYISALNRFLRSLVLEHKLGSETEKCCRAALPLKTKDGSPPCSEAGDRIKKATEELTSLINYEAVVDVLQNHLDKINAAQTTQFKRLQAIPVQPIIEHFSLVRLSSGIRCACEEGSAEASFFRSGQRSASHVFEKLLGRGFFKKCDHISKEDEARIVQSVKANDVAP